MPRPVPKESKRDVNKKNILHYLESYIHSNGFSPSVRDICAAVGFKSTSTVHSYLTELQEEGLISYADGKRRAISLVDENPETEETSYADVTAFPLVGLVTAGQPILAQENIEYNIHVDDKLFPSAGNGNYILRVRGDSMMDAGIFNNDLIIVTPAQTAERNEIVVAMIGDEATVKRFSYIDGEPYLLPENDAFSPIPFHAEDCHIIGRVQGLIRTRI